MVKKLLLGAYVLGYVTHLVVAGFVTWKEMPLMQWIYYMSWQVFYATIWPISWTLLR